jgi:hypothetical protein
VLRSAQHVWLRADATSFEAECEICLHARESVAAQHVRVAGTLRRDADVGFTTCRRGHRIVVRRIGRVAARGTR